jgi:hypothetical protein
MTRERLDTLPDLLAGLAGERGGETALILDGKPEGANGVKATRDELREMAAEALETEEARSSTRGS